MFKKISQLIVTLFVMGQTGSVAAKGTCWRFKNTAERDHAYKTADFSKKKACSQQDSAAACKKEIDSPRREAHKQLGTVGIWAPTCAECSAGKCKSILMEKVD